MLRVFHLSQETELVGLSAARVKKGILGIETDDESAVIRRVVSPHQQRVPNFAEAEHADMPIQEFSKFWSDRVDHLWRKRLEQLR